MANPITQIKRDFIQDHHRYLTSYLNHMRSELPNDCITGINKLKTYRELISELTVRYPRFAAYLMNPREANKMGITRRTIESEMVSQVGGMIGGDPGDRARTVQSRIGEIRKMIDKISRVNLEGVQKTATNIIEKLDDLESKLGSEELDSETVINPDTVLTNLYSVLSTLTEDPSSSGGIQQRKEMAKVTVPIRGFDETTKDVTNLTSIVQEIVSSYLSLFNFSDSSLSEQIGEIMRILISGTNVSDIKQDISTIQSEHPLIVVTKERVIELREENTEIFKSTIISELSEGIRQARFSVDTDRYSEMIDEYDRAIMQNLDIEEKTQEAVNTLSNMAQNLGEFALGKTGNSYEPIRSFLLPKLSIVLATLRVIDSGESDQFSATEREVIRQIIRDFENLNSEELIVSDDTNKDTHQTFRDSVLEQYDQITTSINADGGVINTDNIITPLRQIHAIVKRYKYKEIMDRMQENFRGGDSGKVNNFLRLYNQKMTPSLSEKINVFVAQTLQSRQNSGANSLIERYNRIEKNNLLVETLRRLTTKSVRKEMGEPDKIPRVAQQIGNILNKHYNPNAPAPNALPDSISDVRNYDTAREFIDAYNNHYSQLSHSALIRYQYVSSIRLIPAEFFVTEYTERIVNTVFTTVTEESDRKATFLRQIFEIDESVESEQDVISSIRDNIYAPDMGRMARVRQETIQTGGDRSDIERRLAEMKGANNQTQQIKNIEECLTILSGLVMQNTVLYIRYNELVGDYGQNYSHIYSYLQFLMLIATNQFYQDNYVIYKYINKGTIEFYKRVMNNMLCDLEQGSSEPHVTFVRKHYYTVVYTIARFLNKASIIISNSTDILDVRSVDHTAKDLRNSLILLNYFKPILESYNEMFQSKLTIYARLNDIKTEIDYSDKIFVSDLELNKNERDLPGLEQIDIEVGCGTQIQGADTSVMHTKISSCTPLESRDSLEDMETRFTEVFDSVNFPENSDISKYMTLETQLAKKKGVCIMTYGYSGTGKTYTLFGAQGGKEGVLKSTLVNINGLARVDFRLFELYGLGLPYHFYWNEQPGQDRPRIEDIYHKIYHYTLSATNEEILVEGDANSPAISEVSAKNFRDYIENRNLNEVFDSPPTTGTTYETIQTGAVAEVFGNFSNFTDQIDQIRKKAGRIRETPNNPESSRSILVYDFNLFIGSEKPEDSVRFMIIDLPGREEIAQTYVDPYFEKNVIKDLIKKGAMMHSQIGDQNIPPLITNGVGVGEPEHLISLIKMIVTSMALNPLSLGVFTCKMIFDTYNSAEFKPSNIDKSVLTDNILKNPINDREVEAGKMVPTLRVAFEQVGKGLKLNITKKLVGFTTPLQYYALASMFIMSELVIRADFKAIKMIYRKILDRYINYPISNAIQSNLTTASDIYSIMKQIVEQKFKATKGLSTVQSIVSEYYQENVGEGSDLSEAEIQSGYAALLRRTDVQESVVAGLRDNLQDARDRLVELLNYDYVVTPFEGVYINENIVGLIDFLSRRFIKPEDREETPEQKRIEVSDLRNTTRTWLLSQELTDNFKSNETYLSKVNELFNFGPTGTSTLSLDTIRVGDERIKIPKVGTTYAREYQPLFHRVEGFNESELNKYVGCDPEIQKRVQVSGGSLSTTEHFVELNMNAERFVDVSVEDKDMNNPDKLKIVEIDRLSYQQQYMASNYISGRIFNKSRPLIQDILDPYIDTADIDNNESRPGSSTETDSGIKKINDYKIFYLFGNYDDKNKVQYKCEHQINLLENTKEFISAVTPKRGDD